MENPGLIDAVALGMGIPPGELKDFRQEALLGSLTRKDNWDPEKSSLKTYAIQSVTWDAINYLKKLQREKL